MAWKERNVSSLFLLYLHIVPPEDLDSGIFMRIAAGWEVGDLRRTPRSELQSFELGIHLTLLFRIL